MTKLSVSVSRARYPNRQLSPTVRANGQRSSEPQERLDAHHGRFLPESFGASQRRDQTSCQRD